MGGGGWGVICPECRCYEFELGPDGICASCSLEPPLVLGDPTPAYVVTVCLVCAGLVLLVAWAVR